MADAIKFMLNNEYRTVTDAAPTMTVLQYLRLSERLTGTKEGCAEGDCGACTVIVGDVGGNYKAVNACILFLPVLDGKHVLTVEQLGMNAVQKSMVGCHGSQCGFCTPGFVMSLSALMHNKKDASDENIHDAIAGNLCRCTGYRPIMDAAREANKAKDRFLPADSTALKDIQRDQMFVYEHADGKYFAPVTIDELAKTFAEFPDATLLAGGTDVGLWVTKQHRDLPVVIYTGNVAALKNIVSTDEGLEIGAAVSYADAFTHLAAIDESFEELLRRLGSAQIRNSGTLGGNIANGSPIGDGMPPLIALGARIVLRSSSGARDVALEDYFLAYRKQDRRVGEFVEKIIVSKKADNVLFKTYKLSKRFDQDISAVCAAFALTLDAGVVTSARIAFGGMAATPKRASITEQYLHGKTWNEETAKAAMSLLAQDYAPLKDMRASAEYRSLTAQNLLYRFYVETTTGEKVRVYGH